MASRHNRLHADQRGLVSFMIVTVLMLITTLIVLSFARLVSREQIQTLDRQLNAQAQYAAESGVNDAMNALISRNVDPAEDYGDCGAFIDEAGLDPNLGNGASYSCLLVNAAPLQLEFPGVNMSTSLTTKLKAAEDEAGNPREINSIEITWSGSEPGAGDVSGCPSGNDFPATQPSSCEIGTLRFELLPFTGGMDRDALITSRAIGFLRPVLGGSTTNAYSNFSGIVYQGTTQNVTCSNGSCSFRLTGVNMAEGYLRLKSVYANTPVVVRAYDSSNKPLPLIESQVEIDVTGRAGGVIKRIKTIRQLSDGKAGALAPEFAVQSRNTICKRFTFQPPGAPGAPGAITVLPVPDITGEECNPQSE